MLKYYDWNEKRLVKYYDWEQAEALYKVGRSSRQIESETGIPHATFIRKANAEGWVKGELIPLIRQMVKLVEELMRLSPAEFEAVMNESNKELIKRGIKPVFFLERLVRKHRESMLAFETDYY